MALLQILQILLLALAACILLPGTTQAFGPFNPFKNCTYGNCDIHITPGCLAKDPRHVDLWCPGDKLGGDTYECYKIPTLLRIPNSSTLLGFIEARKHSCDDAGYIDLLLKRSFDLGRTWSEPTKVYGNSTEKEWHTIGDALPVYDRIHKMVHLVFTRDNQDVLYSQSADNGASWSKTPRNISSSVLVKRRTGGKHNEGIGYVGTGHASGHQLPSGRLLFPVYGGGLKDFLLASDDHGASFFRLGEVDVPPNEWDFVAVSAANDGSGDSGDSGNGGGNGNTRLLASLRDGTLLGGHRYQAVSEDGGSTWSKPTQSKDLVEPFTGCEGAMVRHPNGKVYYSHPDPSGLHLLRNVMNIKVSEDEGQSWQQHATIWGPGHGCDHPCVPAASYSSMAVLGDEIDSEIGLFYMRNNVTMIIFEGRGASFTTFKP